jgi:hypothetical protein
MSVFKESGPVSFSEIREFLGEEPGQPLSMSSLYNVPGSLLNNKGIVGVNIPISRSLPISLSNFYGMSNRPYQLGTFAFTDTGPFSFELNWKSVADVLVVAGGGSGGGKTSDRDENLQVPGGGGAGGLVLLSKIELPIRTYTGTVGDGGKIAFNVKDAPASNGENSTLAISDAETVTALGGGYGGGMQGTNGGSGGSGGGQGVWAIPTFNSNTALGTTGMGNNGGFGARDGLTTNISASGDFTIISAFRAGGGGGAGSAAPPQLRQSFSINTTTIQSGASPWLTVSGTFYGNATTYRIRLENLVATPGPGSVDTIQINFSCTFRFERVSGFYLQSAAGGFRTNNNPEWQGFYVWPLNLKPILNIVAFDDQTPPSEIFSNKVESSNAFVGSGWQVERQQFSPTDWVEYARPVLYTSGVVNLTFPASLPRPVQFAGRPVHVTVLLESLRAYQVQSPSTSIANPTMLAPSSPLQFSTPIDMSNYTEGYAVPGSGMDLSSHFGTEYGDQGWFSAGGEGGVRNIERSSNLQKGGGGLGSVSPSGRASTNGMPNTGGGGGDWRNGGSGIVLIKIVSHITVPILNPSITETSVFEEDSLEVKSVTYAFSPFLPSEFNQPGIVVRIFQGEELRFESSAAGPPTLPRVADVSNAGFTFTSRTDQGFGYNGWLVQLVNASGAFLSERTAFPEYIVPPGFPSRPILNPIITNLAVFDENSLRLRSVTYAFSPFLPSEFSQPGIVVRIFQGEDLRFESSAAGPPTLPRVVDVSNVGFTFTSRTDQGFGYNDWLVQLVNASGTALSYKTPFPVYIVPLDFVPYPVAASSFTPFFTTQAAFEHFLDGARGQNLTRTTTVGTFDNIVELMIPSPNQGRPANRVFSNAILQARVGDTIRMTGILQYTFGEGFDSDTPSLTSIMLFHIKYGTTYELINQASQFMSGGGSVFERSFDYTIPPGTANGSYALAISSAIQGRSSFTSTDYHTLQIF